MDMSNRESQMNIISNPEEASEDRGPLVEDSELDGAKTIIEGKVKEVGVSSAEDVMAFLDADDADDDGETYDDFRVPLARDTRPMLAAWHEYKAAMAQVKTSYKLWKIEAEELGGEGDQRREAIVQNAARIKRALDAIEIELKDAFPQLSGVAWLTRAEMLVMPRWMHKILGITVNASDTELLEAQNDLKERLDGAKSSE